MSEILFTTVLSLDRVLDITSKNLYQFDYIGQSVPATVRSQVLIIGWNMADTQIYKECEQDVDHPRFKKFIRSRGILKAEVTLDPEGIRITIFDEEVDNPWQVKDRMANMEYIK